MVSDNRKLASAPILSLDEYRIVLEAVTSVLNDLSNTGNLHKIDETNDLVGFCESLSSDLVPAYQILDKPSVKYT